MLLYAITNNIISSTTIIPTTKLENSLSSIPIYNSTATKHRSAIKMNKLLYIIPKRKTNSRGTVNKRFKAGTRID